MRTPSALAVSLLFAAPALAGDPGEGKSFQKIGWGQGGLPFVLELGSQFGREVVNAGDIDGDGVVDLAVAEVKDTGAGTGPNGPGAVWILFMNPGQTVRSVVEVGLGKGGFTGTLAELDAFGDGMAGLGDLDGDGVPDLAVGASGDTSSTGAVWILFMNADGTVKGHHKITSASLAGASISGGDYFGLSITNLGDLDGDGVVDIAVGANGDDAGGNSVGAAWVLFLAADGSVKAHRRIASGAGGISANDLTQASENFGTDLDAVGDLDGDGVVDLVVGAGGSLDIQGVRGGGIWTLLMNPDGTVKAYKRISEGLHGLTALLDAWDLFGAAVAGVGDVDGDGVPDVAVGANGDDDVALNAGAVYVVFLTKDGAVKGYEKMPIGDPGMSGATTSGDRWGASVASLGDVDGDCQVDIVVGATQADGGIGGAFVTRLYGARFKKLGHALVATGGEIEIAANGALAGDDPIQLDVTGAPANAPAYLIVSPAAAYQPALGGTIVPDASLPNTLFALTTDGAGAISLSDTWPAGLATGFKLYVQAWVTDAGAPLGFAATQGLVIIQP